MLPKNLPIIGVCGFSGSGKTTLIEQLLPLLIKRNLKVCVAKHSSKSLTLDRKGKDSDRFYQAGADVFLEAASGCFSRRHLADDFQFPDHAIELVRLYDIVVVEGYKSTPIPKIWLLKDGESVPPKDTDEVIAVLKLDNTRIDKALLIVESFLTDQWRKPPLLGCILIGGKSSRMGQPKHLIQKDGMTWLERTEKTLGKVASNVVVAGEGELPIDNIQRLVDIPRCSGPMAGLLSALRWDPWANVIICACDLPDLSVDALEWLIDQQEPGQWAIIPQLNNSFCEPMLALYNFRIAPCIEKLAAQGIYKLSELAECKNVSLHTPPTDLQGSWRNVNSPDQM